MALANCIFSVPDEKDSMAARVSMERLWHDSARNSHYVGAAKSCQVEWTQSHAGTEPLGIDDTGESNVERLHGVRPQSRGK